MIFQWYLFHVILVILVSLLHANTSMFLLSTLHSINQHNMYALYVLHWMPLMVFLQLYILFMYWGLSWNSYFDSHSPDGFSIWICIQLRIPTWVWYSTWNSNFNGDKFWRVQGKTRALYFLANPRIREFRGNLVLTIFFAFFIAIIQCKGSGEIMLGYQPIHILRIL